MWHLWVEVDLARQRPKPLRTSCSGALTVLASVLTQLYSEATTDEALSDTLSVLLGERDLCRVTVWKSFASDILRQA